MKLARRLVVAGLLAAAGSVVCGVGLGILATHADRNEFSDTLTAEEEKEVRVAEVTDAEHYSVGLTLVAVPLTVFLVWRRSRRRGRQAAEGS